MSTAILGAAGYLGRYVTTELLDRGHDVVAIDIDPDPEALPEAAVTVRGDMTSFAELSSAITEHEVTDLIQLAYFGTPTTGLLHAAEEHPYRASKANVGGFANVVEAARQFDLETVVSASSTVVYGTPAYYQDLGIDRVTEEAPLAPESLYGACKVHNEYLAEMYRDQYGLDIACLRLPLVYGPSRYPGAQPFIVDMFEAAASGDAIHLPGGDSTWDLLYERDVGTLFADVLEAGTCEHPSYNIVGHTVTVRELAELAREHGASEADISVAAGDEAPLPAPLVDTRIRSDVGWDPAYDAETAVLDYLQQLQDRA
ncbi:MAG: NAD(P)-dependent oxidoreductase [Halobacteriales archaeon]|nr:NAD(P)-dependent oxidoreductase [Halobacteriales archaeon]